IERFKWLDLILLASTAFVAGIVLIVALISVPNSADAMAYHLPRVVYWAQNRSVNLFPTPYLNQIMLQPLAEYFMLHAYVISGSDRLTNLVQYGGLVSSVVAVSAIARLLGAGRRGQLLAAVATIALPNGILQASGAKNDYLLAGYLAAMTYFALRWVDR